MANDEDTKTVNRESVEKKAEEPVSKIKKVMHKKDKEESPDAKKNGVVDKDISDEEKDASDEEKGVSDEEKGATDEEKDASVEEKAASDDEKDASDDDKESSDDKKTDDSSQEKLQLSKIEDEEDAEDEAEDEESEEEEKEKSLEVTGKRERKKVDRFVVEKKPESRKEADVTEFAGRGTAFGEIPYVLDMLSKTHPDELRPLHQIIFGRPGKLHLIRRSLKLFNGLTIDPKDEKQTEKVQRRITRLKLADVKKLLNIFGVERGGAKEELVERAFSFLMCPEDFGKNVPKSNKRKRSTKNSKPTPRKRAKTTNKKKSNKTESSAEEEQSEEEEEEEEKNDEEEEKSKENGDKSESDSDKSDKDDGSDSEDVSPKRKIPAKKTPAKKAPAKKTPAKKTPAKKTPAKKAPAKKTPARKTPAKKATKNIELSSSSEESDDEPLVKKTKKEPTEVEIKAYIVSHLDTVNLEEVTMKKLCQDVYDHYPGFDITHRKDFIKSTVKSILT